jgi:protein SCO1/2
MASRRLIRIILMAAFVAVAAVSGTILFKLYERSQGVGEALIGGPFQLTDQNGRRVSDADFRGRFLLIYFGFTYCPDACPTALGVMSAAIDKLGEAGQRVTPILITVDPARDTQEVLRDYAASFHPRLVALRGSEAETAAVAKAYRIYFGKAEGGDSENYLVDHTTLIYLMGPDGKYLAHFGPQATPDDLVAQIGKYL